MEDDYSSNTDDGDYEDFLDDTDEFLLEDLGVLYSDDSSSDFDAMLVDEVDGAVINLDTSDEDELAMDDDDTESYYDTGTSSPASSAATVDSQGSVTDDETMDAETAVEDGNNPIARTIHEADGVESNVVQVQFATRASQQPTQAADLVVLETTLEITEPSTSAEQSRPIVTSSPTSTTSTKRPADTFVDDDDDGQTCLICMEVWSNSGLHRLASLRCGHLFGQSCINRWLQVARARNQKRCPQCNKPASLKEVRPLYARKLIALDTAERDRLKEQLEMVERERNKLDLELKKSQLTQQLHEKQLSELRTKLAHIQANQTAAPPGNCSQAPSSQTAGTSGLRLSLSSSVDINKEGGCRILAYSYDLKVVVVSQRSTNNLFSGYGISKMNSLNFNRTQFVFLHTKQIRDLAFHTQDSELLLSVSLDRCAKLLDVTSNNVVQSFQTEFPLWSCCWDADNTNIFYVGSQNGSVFQYDMRRANSAIGQITSTDVSPITSLVAIPSTAGGALPRGGFVACHLNSCWAYEQTEGIFRGTQLPLDGPFISMRYDRATEQVLVSSRPSTRSLRARHVVCELARNEVTNSLTCNPIQTFQGSTTQNLMSRPCQMNLRGYGSVVACYQESSNAVTMWNMANGQKVCNHAVRDPILDLCPIYVNDRHYLATLSEKVFQVYKVEAN